MYFIILYKIKYSIKIIFNDTLRKNLEMILYHT